jgi:DNA (cytosine-5)-methyltransferase 1
MLTFGSLFAGIGGFDLGLERAGMECRWQVEIDGYASSVLARRWPHVTRWGDVRTFPVGDSSDWHVDLICAGVPCQPVSHAGKQKGANDDRWMWGEALRVVADLKPRFFVAENPIGLLSHDRGRTFHGILRAFASVGYVCEWHVISAADVGAPHRRERVWLVAHADSVPRTQGEPRRAGRGVSSQSAGSQGREDEGKAWAVAGGGGKDEVAGTSGLGLMPVLRSLLLHDSQEARSRLHLPANRGVDAKPIHASDNLARADRPRLQGALLEHPGEGLLRSRSGARADEEQDVSYSDCGWWTIEPDVGRVAHGVSNRVDRLRCLGNAVVPQVAEVIGRAIVAMESEVKT